MSHERTPGERMYVAFCEHCQLADPGEYPEWGDLTEEAHQRWGKAAAMAGFEKALPVQTPREREPMVWAATYAAAFLREYAGLYAYAEGGAGQRHAEALAVVKWNMPLHREVADAAVLALEAR